jgi:very-short-patch-repair endonuclease
MQGWKFRRQHPVGRYVVDSATIDGRLIVEVDGPTHYLNEAASESDRVRQLELESVGFFVMRVTNADVYGNLDGVLEAVEAQLSGR